MAAFSVEQYFFVALLLAGIMGVVFSLNKKRAKGKALPFALAFSLFLVLAGVFGPLFFNLPSTPFAVMSALSFSPAEEDAAYAGAPSQLATGVKVVKVADTSSKAPIKDAVVIIESEDTVVATGLTDENGVFSAKAPFTKLKVSAYAAPFSTSAEVDTPSSEVSLFLPLVSISSASSKFRNIVPIGPPIFSGGWQIRIDKGNGGGSGGEFGGGRGGGGTGGETGNNEGAIRSEVREQPDDFEIPAGGEILFRQGKLVVWRMITNHKATVPPTGEEVFVSTVTIFAKNVGDASIDSLYLRDEIPFGRLSDVLGVSNNVFNVEAGSVIVTMFFDSIEPSETENGQVSLKVESPVNEKDVLTKFKSPVAVAKQGVDVVQVSPSQSPASGFDLKILGLIIVLVIAAAVSIFFFKRK
ncbi:MAG: hypothetical protein QXR53_04775 [Candidatus Norongarragalinales archaeon]